MDEEAKRKGAGAQRSTLSNRHGRSASRWRILGRAAGESAGSGHSGGLRFLPRLAQGCGRRPPMPANRKESLCVLASLRSAVQYRLNRCESEGRVRSRLRSSRPQLKLEDAAVPGMQKGTSGFPYLLRIESRAERETGTSPSGIGCESTFGPLSWDRGRAFPGAPHFRRAA